MEKGNAEVNMARAIANRDENDDAIKAGT